MNYARVEDLDLLVERGVELEGKIFIARYGKLFRGSKVRFYFVSSSSGLVDLSSPHCRNYLTPGNVRDS